MESDRNGADIPTWLANCSSQGFLFDKLEERFGDEIANKLFYENAIRFFTKNGK